MQLPSGDQWEKASRGVDGRKYPWGNLYFRQYANTQDTFDMNVRMLPVKNLPGDVSIYGVQSMAGNFSDFTADHDPLKLDQMRQRGVRGGDWCYHAASTRCAYQASFEYFFSGIGSSCRGAIDLNG